MTAEVGYTQLATEAQRVVLYNNSVKIAAYNSQNAQNIDASAKGFALPYPDLKPPILTEFDFEGYIELFRLDEQAVKDAAGGPVDKLYDNLSKAFSFYTYVPPKVVFLTLPQPKNPLGALIDDELGLFARAAGDVRPVGSIFSFLGTNYVLTNFGTRNIAHVPMIFWVRQAGAA